MCGIFCPFLAGLHEMISSSTEESKSRDELIYGRLEYEGPLNAMTQQRVGIGRWMATTSQRRRRSRLQRHTGLLVKDRIYHAAGQWSWPRCDLSASRWNRLAGIQKSRVPRRCPFKKVEPRRQRLCGLWPGQVVHGSYERCVGESCGNPLLPLLPLRSAMYKGRCIRLNCDTTLQPGTLDTGLVFGGTTVPRVNTPPWQTSAPLKNNACPHT